VVRSEWKIQVIFTSWYVSLIVYELMLLRQFIRANRPPEGSCPGTYLPFAKPDFTSAAFVERALHGRSHLNKQPQNDSGKCSLQVKKYC
jgi:hypothetical protein